MTTHAAMLEEVQQLFDSFAKEDPKPIPFNHLLVAQHNLKDRFLELIDREIQNARLGLPARITIKLNNLEERVLIKRLYDASGHGVQVDMIVRSICCLVPGVKGMSENIRVRRIVDRFLEHGRIYVFHNGGKPEVFLGSADWMNRNIYHRIEVCFPLYDEVLKGELMQLMDVQLKDNVQAVEVDGQLHNKAVPQDGEPVQSQKAIYELVVEKGKAVQETGV